MRSLFFFMVCIVSLFSMQSYAVNAWSTDTVKIEYINYHSKQESIYPSHKGVLQVRIDSDIPWTNDANCHLRSVIVRNEDTHLISALIAARVSSTPIKLFVDDSIRISSECYLRAVGY